MSQNRREFLGTTGIITAAAIGTTLASPNLSAFATSIGGTITKHVLPPLPYAYNALEPIIDAKTVELHYTKHNAAYIAGLNKAEEELQKARENNDFSLVDYWSKKLSFNGAGAFLHYIYWRSMKPGGGDSPKGEIFEQINKDFGSPETLKNQFTAAAINVEGSGWSILGFRPDDKSLVVLQAENHQKLTTWDIVPLMCIDVWEHAYYLKYQNNRAQYVKNWWTLINWDFILKNFKEHKM